MEKTLLTLVTAVMLAAVPASAQVYRYNPETGKSDNVSPNAPSASSTTQQTSSGKPPIVPLSASTIKSIEKAIEQEKRMESSIPDGSSTASLLSAVNQAIADADNDQGRKMLPLGRVGIILDPEAYNPTIARNAAELNKIPNLDKVFMTPPALSVSLLFLMEWKELAGVEFIADNRNLVQQTYGIKKIPGFVYLRPDGTHTAYNLDDLAPFYEALTIQRRKVGK